jgi:hypothetical protein
MYLIKRKADCPDRDRYPEYTDQMNVAFSGSLSFKSSPYSDLRKAFGYYWLPSWLIELRRRDGE